MKLKICGLQTPEALELCAELGVNYVGLNFVKSTKRKTKKGFYNTIAKFGKLTKVGIFQNQSIEEIVELTTQTNLDIIQLHGSESPDFIDTLKNHLPPTANHEPRLIWKAFSVDENFEKNKLQQYSKNTDLFLFDGKNPGSGSQIVDNTKLLDALFESTQLRIPYGVAGGVNAQNIAEMKEKYPETALLDTASGVETEGKFDPDQLKLLVSNFKHAL